MPWSRRWWRSPEARPATREAFDHRFDVRPVHARRVARHEFGVGIAPEPRAIKRRATPHDLLTKPRAVTSTTTIGSAIRRMPVFDPTSNSLTLIVLSFKVAGDNPTSSTHHDKPIVILTHFRFIYVVSKIIIGPFPISVYDQSVFAFNFDVA